MKIRTLIADDEPHLAEYLREQLVIAWPDIEVVAIVHDGTTALRAIVEKKPQIAFLDVCMPGIDGVGVAWHARDRCKIVFVTAWKEYAVDAFAQGAVDYLIKPITPKRLAVTLRRLKTHFPENGVETAKKKDGIRTGSRTPWVTIKVGSETRAIHPEEILYFEANGNYVNVVGRAIAGTVRQTLRELLDQMPPDIFIQIHRATAVNAARIESVRRINEGALLTLTGTSKELRVSRQFAAQFFSNPS